MKFPIFVVALVASVALAAPADAASKKHKKAAHRTGASAVQSRPASNSYDVYVGNDLVGRDPDPNIRSYMMRDPRPWEGMD